MKIFFFCFLSFRVPGSKDEMLSGSAPQSELPADVARRRARVKEWRQARGGPRAEAEDEGDCLDKESDGDGNEGDGEDDDDDEEDEGGDEKGKEEEDPLEVRRRNDPFS